MIRRQLFAAIAVGLIVSVLSGCSTPTPRQRFDEFVDWYGTEINQDVQMLVERPLTTPARIETFAKDAAALNAVAKKWMEDHPPADCYATLHAAIGRALDNFEEGGAAAASGDLGGAGIQVAAGAAEIEGLATKVSDAEAACKQ